MVAVSAPADVRDILVGLAALMAQASALLSCHELPGGNPSAPPWPGGQPPYGYCSGAGFLLVDPVCADVVRLVLSAGEAGELGPRLRRMPGVAGWSSDSMRKLVWRIRRRAAAYRAGEVMARGQPLRHPSLVIAP